MKEKVMNTIHGPLKHIIMISVVMSLYSLGLYFSLYLLTSPSNFSIFFVPSGLAVGLTIVYGYRTVFLIFLTKILYYFFTGSDLAFVSILITATASAIEAFLGLYIYRSLINKNNGIYSYTMVLSVALIAPVLPALVGVWHKIEFSAHLIETYFQNFYIHYTGDFLGILIVLPLFINIKEHKEIKVFDYVSPFIALFISYIYNFQFSSPFSVLILMAIFIPAFFGTNFGLSFTVIIVSAFLNWNAAVYIGGDSEVLIITNLLKLQIYMLAIGLFSLAISELKNAKMFKYAYKTLLVLWFFISIIFYYNYRSNIVYTDLYIDQKIHSVKVLLSEKVNNLKMLTTSNEALVNASERVDKKEWLDFQHSIISYADLNIVKTQALIQFDDNSNAEYFVLSHDKSVADDDILRLIEMNVFEKYYYKSVNYSELVVTPLYHFTSKDQKKHSVNFMIKANKVGEQIKSFSVVGFDLNALFTTSINDHFNKIDVDIYESNLTSKNQLILSQRVTRSNLPLGDEDDHGTGIVTHFKILNATFKIHWNDSFSILSHHDNTSPVIIFLGSLITLIFSFFLIHKKYLSLVVDDKNPKSLKKSTLEAQEKFKLLFESTSDAVIIFDLNKIINLNQKASDIFGIDFLGDLQGLLPAEVLGLRPKDNLSDQNYFKSIILDVNINSFVSYTGFLLTKNTPVYATISIQQIHHQDHYRYMMIASPIIEHQSSQVTSTFMNAPAIKERPLTDAVIQAVPAPIEPKKNQDNSKIFQGQKVLLVEDNEVNVLMTRKYLEKWGLEVDVAENGKIAVAKALSQKYSLILMDIHMPVMDGYEATRIIRQTNQLVPIVALSADVLNNLSEEQYFVKFTDFIPKPFRPDDFLNKMKTYIK